MVWDWSTWIWEYQKEYGPGVLNRDLTKDTVQAYWDGAPDV